MNKSILILKREYLTRVKKKSFIIITILVPFFMAGIIIVPAWLATRDDKQERKIAVYDETSLFTDKLSEEGHTSYHFVPENKFTELKDNIHTGSFYAILHLPEDIYSSGSAKLISHKQVPFELSEQIKNKLKRIIESDKREKVIEETNIPGLEEKLAGAKIRINLSNIKISESGEEKKSSSFVTFGISYAMGFIIYFFVFMYGSMVMRSVMEEKKSRIVEVIISSVKPFQLMFGKIVGTALVGLTQVLIWIFLGFIGLTIFQLFFAPEAVQEMSQSIIEGQQQLNPATSPAIAQTAQDIIGMIGNLNIPFIIFSFLFYFLGGYLLYSSLLGAVGAAVDNEEDIQQMVFPVTFPLILSIIMLFAIAKNPEGPVAFWASIIPLTSPVAMLARVPYGVPLWEFLLSAFLLVVTTLGVIWAAAKIYRIGILMYGKKVNLKELVKWIRYRG